MLALGDEFLQKLNNSHVKSLCKSIGWRIICCWCYTLDAEFAVESLKLVADKLSNVVMHDAPWNPEEIYDMVFDHISSLDSERNGLRPLGKKFCYGQYESMSSGWRQDDWAYNIHSPHLDGNVALAGSRSPTNWCLKYALIWYAWHLFSYLMASLIILGQ